MTLKHQENTAYCMPDYKVIFIFLKNFCFGKEGAALHLSLYVDSYYKFLSSF